MAVPPCERVPADLEIHGIGLQSEMTCLSLVGHNMLIRKSLLAAVGDASAVPVSQW